MKCHHSSANELNLLKKALEISLKSCTHIQFYTDSIRVTHIHHINVKIVHTFSK